MGGDFTVKAAAGSLREAVRADVILPHRWTDEGVAVELEFTGAHLLHLAAAGCVLNDTYREAVQPCGRGCLSNALKSPMNSFSSYISDPDANMWALQQWRANDQASSI
jgi:hypothetical protein